MLSFQLYMQRERAATLALVERDESGVADLQRLPDGRVEPANPANP